MDATDHALMEARGLEAAGIVGFDHQPGPGNGGNAMVYVDDIFAPPQPDEPWSEYDDMDVRTAIAAPGAERYVPPPPPQARRTTPFILEAWNHTNDGLLFPELALGDGAEDLPHRAAITAPGAERYVPPPPPQARRTTPFILEPWNHTNDGLLFPELALGDGAEDLPHRAAITAPGAERYIPPPPPQARRTTPFILEPWNHTNDGLLFPELALGDAAEDLPHRAADEADGWEAGEPGEFVCWALASYLASIDAAGL